MVDRILRAITPALSFELEHLIEETRQELETQYNERLQAAELAQHVAVERAIRETRESVRAEIAGVADSELEARINQTLAAKEEEQKKAAQEWSLERDRLNQEIERLRILADAQTQLTEASSQPEMLIRWLRLAQPFAKAVAVYTTRGDGLALWKSRGEAVFPEITSAQVTDPECYFKPIIVRDKIVAAVCALPPFQVDLLNFLAATMERAILIFGLKLRAPGSKPDGNEAARTTQKF